MSRELHMFLLVVAMAGITYLIRVIPMILFKKKIKSNFINSLLYYVPYAVLSAMTFPAILYSSGNVISASIGTAVAMLCAFFKRSLVVTALIACATVLICEVFITYVFI
ncbi:MAG: AzlD domain-containing protein [Clostridia bacterium]|nr:AzlD domain-containing protein [Clostridia bacterium]